MRVTDNQQPQLGKLNFRNELCKLQTSLCTGLSVLLSHGGEGHAGSYGIHHPAASDTQWYSTVLVAMKSSS